MNERIKKVRLDSNLSMKDFADRLGLTVASISRYENGERTPSNAVITAISKEFSVNYDWLMTGKGSMMKTEEFDDTPAKILRCYDNLTDRLKDQVRVLATLDPEWWKTLDKAFEEMEKRKSQK